jgi:formylmethanofuran dehydrogenase subunit B
LVLQDGSIESVRNGCAISEAKFKNFQRDRILKPLIRKNGELVEASWKDAIQRCAEILVEAYYPVLYGWSSTSCEAIRKGLELAEEVGGVIDNTATVCHGPSILSIQDRGISSCTLGQLRHRADLVIYWGCDPWSAHPRHIERYTAFSHGRFQASNWRRYVKRSYANQLRKRIERVSSFGPRPKLTAQPPTPFLRPVSAIRAGRKIVVVDARRTRTAEAADFFLQVRPNTDYEIIQALRMLIRDEDPDVEDVAGIPIDVIEGLADIMINCELGILFFGVGLTMSMGKLRNIDAALSLVRDLNRRTKFLIMPMRGHFNVTGANVVFTWQTGYPYAVDFTHGYPRYNPGETSAVDILSRGEADAALVIASDPVSNFPKAAVKNLMKIPIIAIDPAETPTTLVADVVLPSTFVGIETEGTAYRMDHVPLPLKKIVNPPQGPLPDEEIIQMILEKVRGLKQEGRG